MTAVHLFYTLVTLLAGGAAADKLVVHRYKIKIHDYAVKYWFRLSETPIPELPKITAIWILKVTGGFTKDKFKRWFFYTMASFLFLSLAYEVHTFANGGDWKKGVDGDFWDILPLPHIGVLLVVVFFDNLTIALMRRLLIKIQTSGFFKGITAIFSYVVMLAFLMICCLGTMQHVESILINNNVIGERGAQADLSLELYSHFITESAKHTNNFNSLVTIKEFNISIPKPIPLPRKYSDTSHTNIENMEVKLRYQMASNVYSHIDNTYIFDLNQSIGAFSLLVEGYPAKWVATTTCYFHVPNNLPNGFANRGFYWQSNSESKVDALDYLLAGTLAVPAIVTTFVLFFICVSKMLLGIFRRVSMYFLDLVSEPKPAAILPFTLLASAADVVLLLVKFLTAVIKVIYSY